MKKLPIVLGLTLASTVTAAALACGGKAGKIDANQDGKVSLEEHLAGVKQRFERLDANRDGVIDKDEAPGRFARFLQKKDANGDGKITLSEMETKARAWFKEADKNSDGVLTKEEFRPHRGHGKHRKKS
ncbi:MAG TPA: EF-hand domain-containing protein [Polyangiaceae bacterium]|nr:EF-hand domain-containing protein [Polyangiaceae bacterium]